MNYVYEIFNLALFDLCYGAELNNDGTKAIGMPRRVYDGWQYPEDWNETC